MRKTDNKETRDQTFDDNFPYFQRGEVKHSLEMLIVCPKQHCHVTKTTDPYLNPNTAPELCHSGSGFFNLTSMGV